MSCTSCRHLPVPPPRPAGGCLTIAESATAPTVVVPVKPKRPPSTSTSGVRGAAGLEVGKGAVKEVTKPKAYTKVFGGGKGKLEDVGERNSWAHSWLQRTAWKCLKGEVLVYLRPLLLEYTVVLPVKARLALFSVVSNAALKRWGFWELQSGFQSLNLCVRRKMVQFRRFRREAYDIHQIDKVATCKKMWRMPGNVLEPCSWLSRGLNSTASQDNWR